MKSKYIIVYERMGGTWYYMIYKKGLFGLKFVERCNSSEYATGRIVELDLGI